MFSIFIKNGQCEIPCYRTKPNQRRDIRHFEKNSPEYILYSGPGYGGDGESRTRVRKHFHRTFSERSQCFKISPPWPPINMLPCQLSRCSLRGTENSLQVFPYSRRRYHGLRVNHGRRACAPRRCRTMLLMRNCCYF